ncbi:MAG: PorT family protein [Cyclobacteriaceae bacterium]|nr:PorT family protein [Cyclobacteriaceae bacterium]
MKKLVFVVMFLFPLLAFSQITWGAKGGANITTLGGFDSGNSPQLRAHAGFYYQQRVEQRFGVIAELHYSMQGARATNISRRYLAYNYLNVPFLVKFYNSNDVYFEIGPQFGYLLSANFYDDGFKQNVVDNVKRFDFTGLIGGGKDTDFGHYGVRGGFGFTNTSGGSVGNAVVFRNIFLQLYVGLTIGQLSE